MNAGTPPMKRGAPGQQVQSMNPVSDAANIKEIILAYYRGEIDDETWAEFNERWFHETYSWYPGLEEDLARQMIAGGVDMPISTPTERITPK